ncbi:MAG: 16S rRNA (uracil(1498)-N(3))-methyltransferase [Pseudomonadota bacterium]
MAKSNVRLYVEHPLGPEQAVALQKDQAHYLFGVMRRSIGDNVFLFNGCDGEWRSEVKEAGKRSGQLVVLEQTRPQQNAPDLWLLFAPIKKTRTDFIVEKATELGVSRILPILTEFTNSERIRQDRLQAHAVEAAEQCGGTFVPAVVDLQKLGQVLDNWPPERQILFCDEELSGPANSLAEMKTGPWAILIGPEGGFSETERARLSSLTVSRPVSLGPRILRADTAAVSAITLWQQALGDWQ